MLYTALKEPISIRGVYMNFKEMEFAEVPAFNIFQERLAVLRPNAKLVKSGSEFDCDIFRIYFEEPKMEKYRIDIGKNLLKDLEENPKRITSDYTAELLTKLDALILRAVPFHD